MSEAIKPTPGPWIVSPYADGFEVDGPGGICIAQAQQLKPIRKKEDHDQRKANARLIAEAGTVRHETGLSPRQLVERVKELEEALREYMSAFGQALEAHGIQFAQQQVIADELARAALSKSLPNTVTEVK